MNRTAKPIASKENSSIDTTATVADTQIGLPERSNPFFLGANQAASELFNLLKDGLPATAASAENRLRLEAVRDHCANEIQTLTDGFSALGVLISLTGQVADDAGISGIMLVRLGGLIEHMAVTLDAVHELRSDAAFTLSQAARGAA